MLRCVIKSPRCIPLHWVLNKCEKSVKNVFDYIKSSFDAVVSKKRKKIFPFICYVTSYVNNVNVHRFTFSLTSLDLRIAWHTGTVNEHSSKGDCPVADLSIDRSLRLDRQADWKPVKVACGSLYSASIAIDSVHFFAWPRVSAITKPRAFLPVVYRSIFPSFLILSSSF